MNHSGLRIGLLGGSFNPAHDGHRHLSLSAMRMLSLDQVWWLVSPQNPLKATKGMAPLTQRTAHAARFARHPRIRVSNIESRLGTRFTADTLRRLKRRHPGVRFVWLMGADNLAQLPRWKHWHQIMATVPVAVFDREPYSYPVLGQKAGSRFRHFLRHQADGRALAAATPPAWGFFRMKRHPMSATQVRTLGATPWPTADAPAMED